MKKKKKRKKKKKKKLESSLIITFTPEKIIVPEMLTRSRKMAKRKEKKG